MLQLIRFRRALAVGLCSILVVGCERHDPLSTVTAPSALTVPISTALISNGWVPDSADVQLLARGLALAMRASVVREQFLEDMRDSPFEGHSLPLGSYLRGTRGHVVLDTAARALGVPIGTLERALGPSTTTGLELGMPRYGDRRNWSSNSPIWVVGVAENPRVLALRRSPTYSDSAVAYGTTGAAVRLAVGEGGNTPYFLLSPAVHAFGADPEPRRLQAPKRHGLTIGAPDEQLGMLIPLCDPNVDPSCGGGGGGTVDPGYLVLPSGQTYQNCVSFMLLNPVHADCRAELAWAFRPRLLFNSDEPCPARSPFWAARPEGSGVALYYALSYRVDCGNRSGTADTHAGDSEFIIVRVSESPAGSGHWQLNNVTLSAHYKAPLWTDGTWTGDYPALDFRPGEYRTRPRIYIAYGKHGNYRDTGTCGGGAFGADDCGRAVDVGLEFGFGQGSGQDLGSRNDRVQDCVYPYTFGATAPECYWSYSALHNFSGWLYSTNGATAYTDLFADFGY